MNSFVRYVVIIALSAWLAHQWGYYQGSSLPCDCADDWESYEPPISQETFCTEAP